MTEAGIHVVCIGRTSEPDRWDVDRRGVRNVADLVPTFLGDWQPKRHRDGSGARSEAKDRGNGVVMNVGEHRQPGRYYGVQARYGPAPALSDWRELPQADE